MLNVLQRTAIRLFPSYPLPMWAWLVHLRGFSLLACLLFLRQRKEKRGLP